MTSSSASSIASQPDPDPDPDSDSLNFAIGLGPAVDAAGAVKGNAAAPPSPTPCGSPATK